MTSTHTRTATPTRVPAGLAALLDLVLVVLFAAIGRSAHGETVTGALTTAWPFLVGCALGWVVWAALRRSAPTSLASGVVVWLCTVVGGMVVRGLTGQGTHWSFVIVASIATALFLLGWRAVAAALSRRRGGPPGSTRRSA